MQCSYVLFHTVNVATLNLHNVGSFWYLNMSQYGHTVNMLVQKAVMARLTLYWSWENKHSNDFHSE